MASFPKNKPRSYFFRCLTRRSISFELLGLPAAPQLTEIELVYSLLIIVEIMARNVSYMIEYQSKFVFFFCSLFHWFFISNSSTNTEIINRLFLLIKDWIDREEQTLSNEDFLRILSVVNIVLSYPENTQFISIFNIYWRFVHMLCVRFVVKITSTDPQDVANNETPRTDTVSKLRNLIFVGMTSVDSSIRALFRPLFYRMLPVDYFARLQFLFNIVLLLLFSSFLILIDLRFRSQAAMASALRRDLDSVHRSQQARRALLENAPFPRGRDRNGPSQRCSSRVHQADFPRDSAERDIEAIRDR